MAALFVRRQADRHQPHRMVRPVVFLLRQPHLHQRIAEHARLDRLLRQRPLLDYVDQAVVADPADVAAAGPMNVVEQGELSVPAIHDVAVVGFQVLPEHGLLVGGAAVSAIGQGHARRHVLVQIEVRVQAPRVVSRARTRAQPHRFGNPRQRLQERAVDQRHHRLEVLKLRVRRQRLQLLAQLADDAFQQAGIEDVNRFRQRPERGPRAAELLLHVLQFRRLLDRPQRLHDRVEQE